MTALTTLTARAEKDASLRPLPFRRMAWVIWRQHRFALTGAAALLIAVAVCLCIFGLRLHQDHAAAIACHPASSLACSAPITSFNGTGGFLANGFILQVVPALIGAFVGAPVLARELETGTFRYAWTQGFGRWRWTLAKLVALALTVAVAAGAISLLIFWYYQPYFATGNQSLSLTDYTPLAPCLFDVRGIAFAAWTLIAFAIGGLAGMIIRRVIPAIIATLVVYTGLALLAGNFLRQHYLRPLATTELTVPDSAWIMSQQWLTERGRPVSQSMLSQVLQKAGSQLAGKGGVPKSVSAWQYLVQHGYTQLTTYQPASRFWPFQWIEGGWLLALSALFIAVSVYMVRRRAA